MAERQTDPKAATQTSTAESGDFAALLTKEFKPKSDRAREEVQSAVRTLAEQALGGTTLTSHDTVQNIQALIAELDRKLSAQINQILHHPDVQELEGAWRGLHYLVNNTETDTLLKIKVLNISKKDLGKTLKNFKGAAWDVSPIFKKLYEAEYGTLGGEPYGCLVGDYYFSEEPPDVELLGEISKVCAAAHAPFIAAASPKLFDMDSWQVFSRPPDTRRGVRSASPRTPDTSASRCLDFSLEGRTVPSPILWMNSISKRRRAAPDHETIRGRTRRMRWQ
jgi:type VI secretion system protein ImpC